MVKYLSALVIVVAFVATPAFGQDFPQLEVMMGYGNLGLPTDFEELPTGLGIGTGGHGGFASSQTINMASWIGIDNYLGYYYLGSSSVVGKTRLFTTMFGGKFTLRKHDKFVPYASAGFGAGWLMFPELGGNSDRATAVRYGGGVDYSFHDSLAVRFDVSRMSFNFDGWRSGTNFSTGIVVKLGY